MLKKMLIVVLLLSFVVACSTPQERRVVIEKLDLGEILYQHADRAKGVGDTFVVLDEGRWLYVINVHSDGSVWDMNVIKEIKCE